MQEIQRDQKGFPAALEDLRGGAVPRSLFAIGDTAIFGMAPDRLVAIVGTRNASPYGIKVTTALAEAFAGTGIGVVSGLARGIDAAAHRATMDAGGKTVAVMGTGVNVPYPVGHRRLHAEVAEKGLVVSENGPGMTAFEGCFPRRNRIIAALARMTIVVEAPYKSGAINTATQALNLNRVVAAVPGPIDSPRSSGANLLIREGAQMIHAIDDALALYGVTNGRKQEGRTMGATEASIWDALADGPASIEVLCSRAGLEIRDALEGIARLELNGMVRQQLGGDIERAILAVENGIK